MSNEIISVAWAFLVILAANAGWILACIFAGRKIRRLQDKITAERQSRLNEDKEIVIDLRRSK